MNHVVKPPTDSGAGPSGLLLTRSIIEALHEDGPVATVPAHKRAQVQLVPVEEDEIELVARLAAPLVVEDLVHDHGAESVLEVQHPGCRGPAAHLVSSLIIRSRARRGQKENITTM